MKSHVLTRNAKANRWETADGITVTPPAADEVAKGQEARHLHKSNGAVHIGLLFPRGTDDKTYWKYASGGGGDKWEFTVNQDASGAVTATLTETPVSMASCPA